MEVLYFAWIAERIGRDRETVAFAAEVRTVGEAIGWLAARGGGHAEAFRDLSRVRAALDLELVTMDAPLGQARELALFPPVTGG